MGMMMMGGGPATSKKLDRVTVRRVMGLFAPYRAKVYATLGVVLVAVCFGIFPPWFLQLIIDKGFAEKDLGFITRFSLLTLLATVVGAGLTLLYGYWSVEVGQKIMVDIRNKLFSHLQGMSLGFFTGTRTGEIQSRLSNDVTGVQGVVSDTLTDVISNVAVVLTTCIAMFLFDWRLTLLTLAVVPFFAIVGGRMGEKMRVVRTGSQEQIAELNAMMQESLSVSGVLLTKTSGRRDTIQAKFAKENELLAKWQIKQQVIMYLFMGLIRLIFSLVPALIYWLAGYLMIRGSGNITVGTLVAFTALQTRMFFPLTGLANAQVQVISSFALFDRIFEYLDLKQEITDRPNAQSLEPAAVAGRVTFENVRFRYEASQAEDTLKSVSLTAEPGQLIALVGPSGAGKTTLTYMIPRLYDVNEGAVKIDGIDVRDLKTASLGEIVGAVTQETYLVHSSIRENLQYAKPDATDAEIEEACRAGAIWDHISSLPEGLDTVVGERGYKLSGGEKQRLAIARALLKNPRILILDEATSSLDTYSERLIQESLNRLMAGRTTFAIAHRLSTIVNADQILVLKDGEIVERGKNAELLALNGVYAKLHREQFGVQVIEDTELAPSP